jgi:hypothetical protein
MIEPAGDGGQTEENGLYVSQALQIEREREREREHGLYVRRLRGPLQLRLRFHKSQNNEPASVAGNTQ